MAQIGPHLVTGQIQESAIALTAGYGDHPDHFALICMRNFGRNGLWLAQEWTIGAPGMSKTVFWRAGPHGVLGSIFDPRRGCPLSMHVAISFERFPLCLPAQYASNGGLMARNGALVPRE